MFHSENNMAQGNAQCSYIGYCMCRCKLVDLMNFWASSEYKLLIRTHCFTIFFLYFQKQPIWQITLCLDIFSSRILFYIQQHIIFCVLSYFFLINIFHVWLSYGKGWVAKFPVFAIYDLLFSSKMKFGEMFHNQTYFPNC